MLVDYFYWQYVLAPRWLLEVVWNLQRALFQYFSVTVMLRTLFAHWHKDSMPFRGGTLEQLGMTVLWNIISRAAGFLIRTIVILTWIITETIYAVGVAILIPLFFLWPFLVIIGLATGFSLLVIA